MEAVKMVTEMIRNDYGKLGCDKRKRDEKQENLK